MDWDRYQLTRIERDRGRKSGKDMDVFDLIDR